jgi:hypothetical protein
VTVTLFSFVFCISQINSCVWYFTVFSTFYYLSRCSCFIPCFPFLSVFSILPLILFLVLSFFLLVLSCSIILTFISLTYSCLVLSFYRMHSAFLPQWNLLFSCNEAYLGDQPLWKLQTLCISSLYSSYRFSTFFYSSHGRQCSSSNWRDVQHILLRCRLLSGPLDAEQAVCFLLSRRAYTLYAKYHSDFRKFCSQKHENYISRIPVTRSVD